MSGLLPLALLFGLACSDKDAAPTDGLDPSDSAGTTSDTGTPDSTSPSDTGTPTGTTHTGSTGETGDPVETTPGTLSVFPRELVVDPGAVWTLRTVYELEGDRADVTPT